MPYCYNFTVFISTGHLYKGETRAVTFIFQMKMKDRKKLAVFVVDYALFRVRNKDGGLTSSFYSRACIFIFLFLTRILEWTGTSFARTTVNMYVKYYTHTVSHTVSRNGCMMQQGCIKRRRTLSLGFFFFFSFFVFITST